MKQIRLTLLGGLALVLCTLSLTSNASFITPYAGLGVGGAWLDASAAQGVYGINLGHTGIEARTHGLKSQGAQMEVLAGITWHINHYLLSAEGFIDPLSLDAHASGKSDSDNIFHAHVTAETTLKIKYLAGFRLLPTFSVGHGIDLMGSLGVSIGGIQLKNVGTIVIPPPFIGGGTDTLTKNETALGFSIGGGGAYTFTRQLSLRALYTYTRFGSISANKVIEPVFIENTNLESGDITINQVLFSLVYNATA